MIVVSEKQQFAALAELANDVLGNYNVHLYSSDVAPLQSNTVGSFTESAFGGYAPKVAQSWIGPISDPVGMVLLTSSNLVWIRDSSASSEIVYGYYVTDGSNLKLLFFERLDTPINMSAQGSGVVMRLNYSIESPTSTADTF